MAGDIGGWIENEHNLCDQAVVCDQAEVSGRAVVCDQAVVRGNAEVRGNAVVSGRVEVCGRAFLVGGVWEITPLYIAGTKWPVSVSSYTEIKIGCELHTIAEWEENGEKIGHRNGFTNAEIAEYRYYIMLCKKWMAEYCPKEA